MATKTYLDHYRLEDVLFLIQYLGLRNEYALRERTDTDGVRPRSVEEPDRLWVCVARQHPEFFRVTEENSTMLWLRYFQLQPERPPLKLELVQQLMEHAMALQQRQIQANEQRKASLPLWTALIAGIFTLLATMVPGLFGH